MLTKLLEKIMPDSVFTRFWKDSQKRALVLLPLWTFFIIWVIFGFVVPYQNFLEDKAKEETTSSEVATSSKTLDDMWLELFKHNYEFEFIVRSDIEIITYKGKSLNDKVSGYKYIDNTYEQFYIDQDYLYLVNDGNLVFHSIYDFVSYEDYLSIDNIYEIIHDINPVVTENQYEFEKDGKYVTIRVLEDNIESISLNNGNKTYTLKFWNINQIKDISY